MKIAYVVDGRMPSEKAHGIFSVQMCRAFEENGAEVVLVYPRRMGQWRDGITRETTIESYYGLAAPLKQHRLPIIDWIYVFENWLRIRGGKLGGIGSLLTGFTVALSLRLHLAANTYDRVYMVNPYTAVFLRALSGRQLGRKVFLDVHGLPQSGIGKRLMRWMLRWLGGAVPLTQPLRQELEDAGVRADAMVIGPMGIDPRDFAIDMTRDEARRRTGLPVEGRLAAYVGKFHTMGLEKGIPEIIEASASLLNDFPDVRFLFVGGPEERVPVYQESIRKLGLDPARFIFLGMQPATMVPSFLAASDVFLMPFPWNHHYAYNMSPMKMFEYMAAGRPIVATRLPSVEEVLIDGENALLAEPGDPITLAAAIRRLLNDPDLAASLSARAREAAGTYSWYNRAAKVLALMDPSSKAFHA
jgi:glycosyltransferase involved in cell wall biosynthesis